MSLKSRYLPWILLACVLLALAKAPGESAWQVLDTLKAERGSGAVNNVTQLRGHRGQDQPEAWEVVTRIPDGERVFVLRGGRIVADTVYSSGGGVAVDTRRLRVDSVEAFRIANRAATQSKVGFDAVDYELRAAAHGNAPLWVLYLRDAEGRDVGQLEIAGEDGRILRQEWFAARQVDRQPILPDPATMDRRAVRSYGREPSEVGHTGSGQVGQGAVIARTTGGLEGAGGRVKEGFRSIGDSFSKIFKGEAVYHNRRDARYQRPGTSKQIRRGGRR